MGQAGGQAHAAPSLKVKASSHTLHGSTCSLLLLQSCTVHVPGVVVVNFLTPGIDRVVDRLYVKE